MARQIPAGFGNEDRTVESSPLPKKCGRLRAVGRMIVYSLPNSSTEPVKKDATMITALVQFQLPQPITRNEARAIFLTTAPKYRNTPGLIRKYYILSQDGRTAGGIYLWKSRQDAERLYSHEWQKFILEKYGASPSVIYFESPVIVDNISSEIISDDEEDLL
jgi:hypothetical protein